MQSTPLPRLPLTYQGATFRRSGIYLAIAAVIILIIVFVKFPQQVPPPDAVAAPPLADILLGFIAVVMFFSAISDALFVLGNKYGKKISCDQDHLYILKRGQETSIPLGNITSIRLAPSAISQTSRGNCAGYIIAYDDDNGRSREFEISVYRQTNDNFNTFKEWAQGNNPSVEIQNRFSTLDYWRRLFKRKDR